MTPIQLYPPIAIATVLMIIWVAGVWHFRYHANVGITSLSYLLWVATVPAALMLYLRFGATDEAVSNGWQIMASTLMGEGFAVIIMFALSQAIFSPRKRWIRIYLGAIAVVFSGFFLFSTFHL